MEFNDHSNLKGKHAFLSASKYHWLNYDIRKLITSFVNAQAVERGTRLHALACELITMGIRLPKTKETLNMYVNDAIGFGMRPEQVLYFSNNCFGTADTILFNERKKILRIHDLKTGETPAHMEQLEIYAALFLLEYERALGVNPLNTKVNLRIYQNDDIQEYTPDKDRVEEVVYGIKEKEAWVQETLMEEAGR